MATSEVILNIPGEDRQMSALTIEREEQVTIIGMHTDRNTQPPHAISKNVWISLTTAFTEISKDRDTRVVILHGANNYFGTGANFHEILQVLDEDERNGDDKGAHEYWRIVNYAHTAIENCPKPVYAMIERFALGAACALAMACDMRIMAEDAKIGIPAPQRGLTLGLRDTRRLVSKVGGAYATEILLEGNIYSAEDGYRMGLANRIVAADKLKEEVMERATRLAKENAPLAMKEAKNNIAMSLQNPGFAGIDETSWPIAWSGSRDLREGIVSFLERRDPIFIGE